MRVQVAERSTIGKRQANEDTVISARFGIGGNDLVLLGVFDGVGGAADGETASRIAADTFLSLAPLVARNLAAGPTTNPEGDQKEITKSLAGIWQRKASNRLRSEQASATNPNMATTCVAAAMSGDVLIGWWLGDSRAYLFREGRLQQLTRDHSTVAELGLSDEEAFDHPKRSEITRFLRASATFEPEIFVEEWRDGDVMLLVSDGVSGSLRGWELETFLAYWLISDISADMLAARLLEHIVPNQSDNASVAVAIRGTPRPLGSAFPQVPLPALLGLGLTENVLSTLVTYPANSAEWTQRPTPPWRDLPESTQILNSHRRHADEAVSGAFVEVIGPTGDRTPFGPEVSLALVAEGGALRKVNDADVSGPVVFQMNSESKSIEIRTPLGGQLETQAIEILDPSQLQPLTFTVENHIIIISFSGRNSLDTPIRIQQRSPDDDVEDVIASTSEACQEPDVSQPPLYDKASDDSTVSDLTL